MENLPSNVRDAEQGIQTYNIQKEQSERESFYDNCNLSRLTLSRAGEEEEANVEEKGKDV